MSWLLLRGLSREKRHWWSFPEALARATGERMLCLDLPGFGTESGRTSPRTIDRITDDIRRRMDRGEREEPWSILGISLGGMVALDWCARYPSDFRHCVTVNTSARPSQPLARFRLAGLSTIAASFKKDVIARELAVLRLTSNKRVDELRPFAAEHARWLGEYPPSRASLLSQLGAASRFVAPKKLEVPLLVLASTTDRLVSHRCSERIARDLIGSKVVICERGGHDLALDEPDWICSEVARFVRELGEAEHGLSAP